MLKTGIVGGLGPESTVSYYKGIIDQWRKRTGNSAYPPIAINSIDMTAMLALVSDSRLDDLADMLLRAIDELEKIGADFAAIASNTPHVVFDRVRERAPIPLISIVAATVLGSRKRIVPPGFESFLTQPRDRGGCSLIPLDTQTRYWNQISG